MSRELSTRQRKFIQRKLEGKSDAQAAREAGYSDLVADVAGRKTMCHPAVQAKLQQLMECTGLTDDRMTQMMAQLEPHMRQAIDSCSSG